MERVKRSGTVECNDDAKRQLAAAVDTARGRALAVGRVLLQWLGFRATVTKGASVSGT